MFLAFTAVLPAGATLFFFVFWRWFGYWRQHALRTYTLIFGTLFVLGAAVYALRREVFASRLDVPAGIQVVGWVLIGVGVVFSFVADRQIGLRVRSFMPFFEPGARLVLRTTGAYAIVRHPIYAAGMGYQLGAFLVTGYLAVAVAWLVFALGACWFTRQEERRLMELLDDPGAYERYRERVPALFPRIKFGKRTAPR